MDVDEDLVAADAKTLGGRIDDTDIRLMRNEEVDFFGRNVGPPQCLKRRFGHHPHGELEDFISFHADVASLSLSGGIPAALTPIGGNRRLGAAAPVGAKVSREDASPLHGADHCSSRPVSEENARAAIRVIRHVADKSAPITITLL